MWFLIENPDVRGMFLIADQNLGMFALFQGKAAEELTRERAYELVKKAIGQPEVAVEVIEVAPWQPEQCVAERFQQGHVLLVGDAAHTTPPKEGLGVNTAIQERTEPGLETGRRVRWTRGARAAVDLSDRAASRGVVCGEALDDRPRRYDTRENLDERKGIGVLPDRRLSLSLTGSHLRRRFISSTG
jgi:FAD binding domain